MDIEGIEDALQRSLTRGWEEFLDSEEFKELGSFSEYLRSADFFGSGHRGVIAHPAHDQAARVIGRRFNTTSRELGLHYNDFFPGDYKKSDEIGGDGFRIRRFYLEVYRGGNLFANAVLSFPHQHDSFSFPASPTIALRAAD